jgi:oligopeptidase B
VAARRPAVQEVHGVRRIDDYAWLRDTGATATLDHLRAERAYYRQVVEPLEPLRRRLESELSGRLPVVDASVTWERDGVVYFTRTRQGDEHDVLVRFEPATGAEQLVFDPNDVGAGGPLAVDPKPDASVVAYLVDVDQEGDGAPGRELRFRDVATGIDLADRLPKAAGAGSWTADGRRYVYPSADSAGRAHQVRCHVLSTPADADTVLLADPDPRFRLQVVRSRDGGWIMLVARGPGTTEVHLASRTAPTTALRCVARRREGVEYEVEPMPGGWDGTGHDVLLIVTDDGAPEFRLVEAPLPALGAAGDPGAWAPVPGLPGGGERLERALVFRGHVVLVARRDGEPFLRVVDRPPPGTDLPRRPATRELHPGVPHGQLQLWHPDEPATRTLVIVEENLVSAPAWVAVDLSTGGRAVIKRASVPGVDPTAYATERAWATAPDGVRVPVTIAHLRDARRGRTAGLVLTGYGAHEVCSWPAFDVATLSLLDRGLVVAVAHVRGGGELGRHWWRAARGQYKARTFVDYVAVRDTLVAAGWAGDVRGGARVVTRGAGAGGLLQAAVYSRAPRMWRAVVAETPVVDVVGDPACGPGGADGPRTGAEGTEWGDAAGSADDFATMLTWSPYDNPPPPGRPSLLVTTSLHDRRIPVHEAARWVARLRATDNPRSASPLLLRVEPGTGGVAGGVGVAGRVASDGDACVGRFARVRYEAEILAWILDRLNVP